MDVNIDSPGARALGVVEARIDLDRPLSAELIEDITDVCARAEDAADADVLVLRLTGTGLPPGGWPGTPEVHLVGKWEKALRRLERVDLFTVGVCEHRCTPAALEILLTTDHRIGGPDTARATADGAPGAMWPGMALHRLVQQVGLAAARRLVLLPATADGPALLDAGVFDEIVPETDVGVAAVVARAAGTVGSETAIRRRLLLEAVTASHEEALGTHLAACERALRLRRTGAAAARAAR
ncbi:MULTISPECIES: enoyl-CoA-hydratase DpgB [unclassified Streptomyces]|uniref:enoyl-CoA-hydratase DpgB n=1 Tax=unclassified Streptomyces TaxID=2593676 RepID=UPI00168B5577|nr:MULTISPECIES: enoyl-CoA-hydratase DpgB [unclassified Streptomyces]MBD3009014.1 enoyl-CoA hydratase/isomerase family protein [Streptomyces sp. 5-10]